MRYVFMSGRTEGNMTATRWWNRIIGAYTYSTTAATFRYVPMPCAGTFRNLMFTVSAAPGNAKTWTINLYVDGVTTHLGITISGATQTRAVDMQNRVHVNRGQQVCITGIGTAGTTVGVGYWTVDFISDKPNEFPICVGASDYQLLTANSSWMPLCNGNQYSAATAARKLKNRSISPIGGRITNWYITNDTAPGVGASWTFNLYQNAVDTGVSVTISGAATSGNTTCNVVVNEGDTLQWYVTPSVAPAPALTYVNWGFCFVSNMPGTWWNGYTPEAQLDITGTTQYDCLINRDLDVWSATESAHYNWTTTSPNLPNSRPFMLTKLYCILAGAPGVGKNWTFTVRVNAASPTNGLSCQIAGASTQVSDVTHTMLIDPFMPLDIMETNNSPATAYNVSYGVAFYTPPEENQNLYHPTHHADRGLGLKRHPRSRIY